MKDKDDIAIYILLFGGLGLIAYAWFKIIAGSWSVFVFAGGGLGVVMAAVAIWIGVCPSPVKNDHIAKTSNMVKKQTNKNKTQEDPQEVRPVLVTNYKRKSMFSIAAAVLNLFVAMLGIAMYMGNGMNEASKNGIVGALASGMQAQYIMCAVAAAFLLAGHVAAKRGFLLIGAILTSIAVIVNIIYLPFMLLPLIFAWVAYARTRPTKIEYR